MVEAVKGAVATNETQLWVLCNSNGGSSGTIPGVLFKLENT